MSITSINESLRVAFKNRGDSEDCILNGLYNNNYNDNSGWGIINWHSSAAVFYIHFTFVHFVGDLIDSSHDRNAKRRFLDDGLFCVHAVCVGLINHIPIEVCIHSSKK